MNPGGPIQLQSLRLRPGSYRQSRALNRSPPVAVSQLAAQVGQPLPISSSDPQMSTFSGFAPAVGIPVSGPNPPLQATGVPTYVVMGPTQPHQFAGSFPTAQGFPVAHGGVQSFSTSGATPPQAMGMGPTKPQNFAGYFPPAPGIPVTQNPAYGGAAPVPPRQPTGFLERCLTVLRCCNSMEECYRLNDSCCAGVGGDGGCCAGVCGCFSGLSSVLDSAPQ